MTVILFISMVVLSFCMYKIGEIVGTEKSLALFESTRLELEKKQVIHKFDALKPSRNPEDWYVVNFSSGRDNNGNECHDFVCPTLKDVNDCIEKNFIMNPVISHYVPFKNKEN